MTIADSNTLNDAILDEGGVDTCASDFAKRGLEAIPACKEPPYQGDIPDPDNLDEIEDAGYQSSELSTMPSLLESGKHSN